MFDMILNSIQLIKQHNPLILNLTNQVTMNFIANGLLSLGASPIMTDAAEELEALISFANAVVINLGTLHNDFLERCHIACTLANQFGKPIVLDPVGAGATTYRTQAALNILRTFDIAILRGNASEIMALAGETGGTKGVDSAHTTDRAIQSALSVSSTHQTTVAISGAQDIVVSPQQTLQTIDRGSILMPQVTGSGCLLTAVIAAFHAVCNDATLAAYSALYFYSVCGEIAHDKAQGPGSFQMHFIDALSFVPKREQYANSH